MKTIKQKIPAKINFTLDILGTKGGYHIINSLVASINLYDTVTLTKRRDNVITLIERGYKAGCPINEHNSFKAAKLFMQTFFTPGVDIIVNKKIPLAGGLGGSSADAVAVLKGLNKLYDINGALKPLAEEMGSDTTYMLDGGFAVLQGRGEEVTPLNFNKKLYLILLTEKVGISAKESYALYDTMDIEKNPTTDLAVTLLKKRGEGAIEHFATSIKNDLCSVAFEKMPVLRKNVARIIESGALASTISGSGSVTYGLYRNKKERDFAYKKLATFFPAERLIKAETLPPNG